MSPPPPPPPPPPCPWRRCWRRSRGRGGRRGPRNDAAPEEGGRSGGWGRHGPASRRRRRTCWDCGCVVFASEMPVMRMERSFHSSDRYLIIIKKKHENATAIIIIEFSVFLLFLYFSILHIAIMPPMSWVLFFFYPNLLSLLVSLKL